MNNIKDMCVPGCVHECVIIAVNSTECCLLKRKKVIFNMHGNPYYSPKFWFAQWKIESLFTVIHPSLYQKYTSISFAICLCRSSCQREGGVSSLYYWVWPYDLLWLMGCRKNLQWVSFRPRPQKALNVSAHVLCSGDKHWKDFLQVASCCPFSLDPQKNIIKQISTLPIVQGRATWLSPVKISEFIVNPWNPKCENKCLLLWLLSFGVVCYAALLQQQLTNTNMVPNLVLAKCFILGFQEEQF